MSDPLAASMIKVQQEKKEQEERAKNEAFWNEFSAMAKELSKKHGRDIGVRLNYTPQGITPGFTIVPHPTDRSPIITPETAEKPKE